VLLRLAFLGNDFFEVQETKISRMFTVKTLPIMDIAAEQGLLLYDLLVGAIHHI